MNSGRDNLMDNNVFVDCKQGISGGWNAGNNVWRQLREGKQLAGFYTNALYLQRYPKIATMLDEPAYNYIWRNLFAECGSVTTGNPGRLDLFENGVYDTDPGFVDAAHGDYRLKPNSPVFAKIGLRPLPLNEVGLYNDAFRASWPVQTAIVQVPDWRAAKKH
jgi:hypothetical protein